MDNQRLEDTLKESSCVEAPKILGSDIESEAYDWVDCLEGRCYSPGVPHFVPPTVSLSAVESNFGELGNPEMRTTKA